MGARSPKHRLISSCVCMAVLAAACTNANDGAGKTSEPDTSGSSVTGGVQSATGRVQSISLSLSEGTSFATQAEELKLVEGMPLSDDEVDEVLGRLPDWQVPESDRTDFNRPPESLRPPLVGDTIDGTFPPEQDSDTTSPPEGGPLEVLRFQPDGDVAIAPFLSITFNQPMVPIATLDQLASQDVPAVVTPPLEGRWRWIGTRTLRFEVNPGLTDRLPAATEFIVEIPAGTTSASGVKLAKSVKFSFTTPPAAVQSFIGESQSLPLNPVFVATFDQVVDPAAVLTSTTLTAAGKVRAIRQATAAEIEADKDASQAVGRGLTDRVVAFVTVEPLPIDSPVVVSFNAGLPSAEGPRLSTEAQVFRAHTFAKLKIVRSTCGYGDGCRPLTPFYLEFNNTIDSAKFNPSMITIEPKVPGLRVNAYGNTIEISGATVGSTTYKVTVDGALGDVFGQTLGGDVTQSFKVGKALPMLQGFDRQFVTVDPAATAPTVSVSTINHDSIRVTAWAVTPAQYKDFLRFLDTTYSDTKPKDPSWPRVLERDFAIDNKADTLIETSIDLSGAFAESKGPLVVRIEPTSQFSPNSNQYWQNRPTYAFVQRTTLGIDAIIDHDELLIWTTDLATGKPLGGVTVTILGGNAEVTTDTSGLARTPLSGQGVTGLVAKLGDRIGMLPSSWYEGWRAQSYGPESRWYVFDDRGIYKPGETAHITGWIRTVDLEAGAALGLLPEAAEVTYRVYDPQGNDIGNGTAELNALGGFNLSLAVPEAANLGQAYIEFQLPGASGSVFFGSHSFQIQQFRSPEFEVRANLESPGPYFVADPATVAVDATYYAGGPLPNADVNWLVSTATTTYAPPGWDDFVFGEWQPWWFEGDFGRSSFRGGFDECFDCGPGFGTTTFEEYTGRTDAAGSHYLQIDFSGSVTDLPATATAEATVFDVNRQAWASRTDLLVHAARFYTGLRTDRPFVEKGTPIRVDVVATDVDGAAVAGREVEVTAGRVESFFENGSWTERVVDPVTCTVTSTAPANSTGDLPRCEFNTEIGGTYRITALITDDDGHQNRTEITQWVTGGTTRPNRSVQQEQVTVVPDAEIYADGDIAELFVQAPFAPAHGLVSLMHGGIESAFTFDAPDGTAVVKVPIKDDYVPNMTVQIDMVGSAERTGDDGTPLPDAPRRTAFASGRIDLPVPPLLRTLKVVATPANAFLEPGNDTSLTVKVSDADGKPVAGAGVAVIVVDEAVLALTGYQLVDPIDVFYSAVYSDVFGEYVRSSVVLSRPDVFSGGGDETAEGSATTTAPPSTTPESEPMEERNAAGDVDLAQGGEQYSPSAAGLDDGSAPIDVRTDFGALAVFAPDETTGADGAVTVAVPLPDNLTRYRVMAVAIDGVDRFGKGESNITARLPLMVRPSAPRFLNFGDRFELPIVVQNQTDSAMSVDVVIQTGNLTLTEVAGKRINVPANDRVEVRFPTAAEDVGTARFRVAAVSGDDADAAAVELPVYTPATAEAFATYGVIDSGAVAQPLLAPAGVFPQFGGLEINTSSTAIQALTDAVLYIAEYRYDSSDGYASRIMAVAALRDVLAAFKADGLPSPAALNAQVARDIERLSALQNDDGGFPYWQRGQRSIPWQSIQSTHALILAKDAGYSVPPDVVAAALEHLGRIEQFFPTEYGPDERNTLSSYALHVRNLGSDRDVSKAETLYRNKRDELQLDAVAWLWPVVDDDALRTSIERLFENRAVETAGAAVFANTYGEDAYVIANSDRRTDGVILDALVSQAPQSDLIPKVVAGLLGNQVRGRWNNVQENAFILLALNQYFETFESVTPDFVARAWLGDLYASEATFKGRTTDRATTLVPMDQLIATGDSDVVLAKDGTGRLYYRLGLRYAPSDLQLEARDEGFVVERIYEAVDDPADVSRDSDGTWHVKAGAKVRVQLTMVADAQRTHVALIDPLPAGFEPQNPSLAVTPTTPPEETADGTEGDAVFSRPWCWCWQWFEHQNLRDDRAEAFTSYLPGGTYEYTYIARATTPGTFVVPPTRAEEIYAPEVFGRSASTLVVVE